MTPKYKQKHLSTPVEAWAVFNMHDPVLVELEMRGEPRSWAKAPSPAVLLTVLLAVVLAW